LVINRFPGKESRKNATLREHRKTLEKSGIPGPKALLTQLTWLTRPN
jgi:hypothetical protein